MTTAILAFRKHIRGPAGIRRLIGLAITASGLVLLAVNGLQALGASPALSAALLATLGTAMATGAGALPVMAIGQVSARTNARMLGFGAGVMLAATAFSLIVPGVESAQAIWSGKALPVLVIALSVMTGGVGLMLMDHVLPHTHFTSGPMVTHAGAPALARRVHGLWMFVIAIALHNIPEGLAIGVSYGSDMATALPVALGIGIQNIPEGLVVALALVSLGYRTGQATLVALATGLLEPVGGLIGAGMVVSSPMWLPIGLGLAAGAMLYAVSHEVIPESHRGGHESAATSGLLLGFVVMMALDISLG